jgi:glycosyltransferase involved in cell wall biosynthesis
MKIIIVGAQYVGSITGGGGVHVVELTRELGKLGHEVLVLCMGLGNAPQELDLVLEDPHNPDPGKRKATVHVKRFFPADADKIKSPFAGTKQQEIDRLKAFRQQVLEYLLKLDGDGVVHIHGHFAVPAMARELKEKGRYKIVNSIHTFESISERVKGKDGAGEEFVKQMEEMEEEAIRHSDHLIVRSEEVLRQITGLFPQAVKTTPISVISSAVSSLFVHEPPPDEFDLLAVKGKYGVQGDLILNVNRIDPSKGIENLLGAYPRLYEHLRTKPSLVIAGMIEKKNRWYHDKLQDIIAAIPEKEIRDSISIHQNIPEPDKLALFELAKVFVVSSLLEPFGITMVEALAKNVPVVASGVEGPKAVMNRKEVAAPFTKADGGLLVNYDDADKRADNMFEALKHFFENPKEIKESAALGRAMALGKYSWEGLVERKLEIYRKVGGI